MIIYNYFTPPRNNLLIFGIDIKDDICYYKTGTKKLKGAEKMIEVKELNKSFGDVHAVCDLSFKVKDGEFFAFLGENGAGKSTTISIICGELPKDSGTVTVNGENTENDSDAVKRSIGAVFQESALDKQLTVRDNLKNRAALYGIYGKEFEDRLSELAKLLDFEDLLGRSPGRQRKLGQLSGGQRRRIDVARALLHKPTILILDEPTTGLDPQTRRTLWNVIAKLRKENGMTVFLTTHYMEETADADYVVIMDKGRICAEGSPISLKNRYTGDFITLYGVSEDDVSALGLPCLTAGQTERLGGAYRVKVENTAAATKLIIAHPELFNDYEITKGNMDDVFLAVTGRKLDSCDTDEKEAKRI